MYGATGRESFPDTGKDARLRARRAPKIPAICGTYGLAPQLPFSQGGGAMQRENDTDPKRPSLGNVLVVDDSKLVRMIVTGTLKNGGYDVTDTTGGAQALELLAKGDFDVVITDLSMPGMDGFEVLAGVKRVAPHVEVIILTGTHAADMSCAVRALRLGAHDYLAKPPSSPDAVLLTVGRAVEKKRLKDANDRLVRELDRQCRTDSLTGALNRRSLDEVLPREIARAQRHGDPLGIVMLDIDHFKAVNDLHGHHGGDEVLRAFARVVMSLLREEDLLFRYGGEEFAVLVPHTNAQGALCVAERIVAAIAAAPIQCGHSRISVTTSAGVAGLTRSTQDAAELTREADAALFEAKKGGRNRAVAARARLSLVAASA